MRFFFILKEISYFEFFHWSKDLFYDSTKFLILNNYIMYKSFFSKGILKVRKSKFLVIIILNEISYFKRN